MELRIVPATRLLLLGGLAGWAAHLAVIYLLAPVAGIETGSFAAFVGAPAGDGSAGVWTGRLLLLAGAVALAIPFRLWDQHLDLPTWEAGITYGLAVWLATGVVLLPLLGALYVGMMPAAAPQPGLLGAELAGLPGMLISATGHALYGLVLGLVVHHGRLNDGRPAS